MGLYSAVLLPMQGILSVALLFLLLSSYSQTRRIHRAGQLLRWDWLAIALLFAVGAALRLLLPPPLLIHTNFHALYFLENALGPRTNDVVELLGRAPYGLTNYSFFQLCWAYLPRSWPVHATLNLLLSAATVPLTYLLVRLLDGTTWWALAAAALLMLLPAHLKMSPTESEITLSSFFAMLALVHWVAFLRAPDKLLLAGTLVALLLTVHSRVLTLGFPLALFITWFVVPRELRRPLPRMTSLIGGGLWAILALPQYLYVLSFLGLASEPVGQIGKSVVRAGSSLSLVYASMARAFTTESNLLFDFGVTPLTVPLALAMGSALIIWRRRWSGALLVMATVLLMMLYHIHSGHLLDRLRYQFFLWPFVGILAGFSIAEPCAALPTLRWRGGVLLLWLGLLTWGLVARMPFITVVPPSSQEASFVLENISLLPENTLLLEPQPLATSHASTIAPLAIPSFILEEAKGGVVSLGEEAEIVACRYRGQPVTTYVGLQNNVFHPEESCPNPHCLRIAPEVTALGCRLLPVLTTKLRTEGPTPGPDLEFRVAEVEVGFYRLEP